MRADFARTVVDTNVILSAALSPNGVPAEVVDWLLGQTRLVFTQATFAELESRIWKPKFDRFLSVERRQEILHAANVGATWVVVSQAIAAKKFCRDPTDDKFIHAALAVGPAWLVTGDNDLLVLADNLSPLGVRIASPAQALVLRELPQDRPYHPP